MHLTIDYLSIWEIAHRWLGHDPNLTDPKALPLPVQDTLRTLTYALVVDELHVLNQNGIQYDNFYDIPSRNEFIPPQLLKITNEILEEDKEKGLQIGRTRLERMTPEEAGVDPDDIDEQKEYFDFFEARYSYHRAAIDGLDRCYKERHYDKQKLESIYLDKYDVYKFCRHHGMEVPPFWISAEDIKEFDRLDKEDGTDEKYKSRGRHCVAISDRERCRVIAETLWHDNPTLSIADIIKHPALLKYGNGWRYRGHHTLRDWVKDLDPRPANEKVGRPKKPDNELN